MTASLLMKGMSDMDRVAVDPTAYANNLLGRAMTLDTNQILKLCVEIADGTSLEDKALARIQKQVLEVVKIRNNLALMLSHTDIADPRQIELFGEGRDIRPEDFA